MSLDNPLTPDDSNPDDYVFSLEGETNGEEEENAGINQDESANSETSDETDSNEEDIDSSGLEGQEETDGEEGEEDETTASVDLETFHKKLTQPFKANGKEYQFDDPEDLLTLAKQGLNYTLSLIHI